MQFFKLFVPTTTLMFVLVETVFVTACYVVAGYLVYDVETMKYFYLEESGALRLTALLVFLGFSFYLNNLYADIRVRHRIRLLQQICFIFGLAFLYQATIDYIHPKWIVPRWMMISGSMAAVAAILAWRVVYTSASARALGFQRFLFLGNSPMVFEVAEYLSTHPELGLEPVGYLDENPSRAEQGGDESSAGKRSKLPRLGSVDDLDEVIRQVQPNCVAVGLLDAQCVSTERLLDLRFTGLRVEDVPRLYEVTFGKVCVESMSLWDSFFSSEAPGQRVIKQPAYSIVLALLLILLLSPLLVLTALAIALLSGRPILQRSKRVGLHQEPFELLDFRITPATRWVEKLHLSHLPRLFNLLRGEMAFVGPAPEHAEYAAVLQKLVPFYSQRFAVPPGLTCWAAAHAPGNITGSDGDAHCGTLNTLESLDYDLYYIKNYSFALDTYILLSSLKTLSK